LLAPRFSGVPDSAEGQRVDVGEELEDAVGVGGTADSEDCARLAGDAAERGAWLG